MGLISRHTRSSLRRRADLTRTLYQGLESSEARRCMHVEKNGLPDEESRTSLFLWRQSRVPCRIVWRLNEWRVLALRGSQAMRCEHSGRSTCGCAVLLPHYFADNEGVIGRS